MMSVDKLNEAAEPVLAVYEKHKDELDKINKRMNELRKEFRRAYDDSDLQEVFCEHDDSGDSYTYDQDAYYKVDDAASKFGYGLTEDYYLWLPSTTRC